MPHLRIWLTLFLIISFGRVCPVQADSPKPKHRVFAPRKHHDADAGILYGRIDYVSPDFRLIGVHPMNKEGKKQRAHIELVLDRNSIVKKDGVQQPKAILQVGQKTAVRYFAEEDVAIADAVFIVVGEFRPEDYKKKVALRASPDKPEKNAENKEKSEQKPKEEK